MREAAHWVRAKWSAVSERRVAKLMDIPRSTLRYGCKGRGAAMLQLVRETALRHARYGHRRVTLQVEKELGRGVSRRNVQRIMQRENLQVRTRRRRKWAPRPAPATAAAQGPDERWAMDFVSDWCVGVRRQLRILTMVDCCPRETLAL